MSSIIGTLGVLLAAITCIVVALIVITTLERSFRLEILGGITVTGLAIAIGVLIQGGLLSLTLVAVGELIDLMIALEENTNLAMRLLRQQVEREQRTNETNMHHEGHSTSDADSTR